MASTEQLIAEMGPGAAEIAEIVPSIRSKITELETPPALEPEAARFRLFDSITTFLMNAARNQPLMLVLDDLHWADRSSLLLLEFLVRELAESQLLLVGCYRDTELSRQHPLADTLAQLSREPVFRRQVLRGLGQDELGQFIEAATGVQLSQELTGTLYSHTEGNPFFMTEVIRLLSESGELTAEHIGTPEGLRVPEGVREVIAQRLNRSSAVCNEVLTTASIIGREFDFRLLSILGGETSEDQLLQAVNEAVSFHLIDDVPGQMDRYQFSHALIQQTLAEEITTSHRVRLHARIGEGLEELYGDDVEAHAAELAHHFAEAQTSTGPTKLVRYSLVAGERALGAYAWEDALAHLETGLVARNIALSGTEAAPDDEAAALLFGLARAQAATLAGHQLEEAFANLSRAFEYYAEAGNVALAVAAAEFPIASLSFRIPGIAELMVRAIALVPADSHEAGRLLSRYGRVLGATESDYEGAHEALARATSIARREGDGALEVRTLSHAAALSYTYLHWQESIDNGPRAIELAAGVENLGSVQDHRWRTALSLLHLGKLNAALPHALILRDRAERRGAPRLNVSNCFVPITYLLCLEGGWKEGREYSEQGLEASPLNPHLLLPRVLLEHEAGESAQAEVYLERLLDVMRRAGPNQLLASVRVSLAISAITRVTSGTGRLDIAEAAAEAALSDQSVTPSYAIIAKASLALLAVQAGDETAAEEHYAYLLGLGQRGTMIWTLSFDRLLGLLSQTMADFDQAAAHFEDALSFCRKAGYRPELAWTCCDYADLLMVGTGLKPAPSPPEKPMALLEESLSIATELGMRPLVERVTERLEQVQALPETAPAYPGGLTEREVEVLRLIAGGKTNLEIAKELTIAEGTARRHVANIYEKIGAANRVEATVYATQNGLSQ